MISHLTRAAYLAALAASLVSLGAAASGALSTAFDAADQRLLPSREPRDISADIELACMRRSLTEAQITLYQVATSDRPLADRLDAMSCLSDDELPPLEHIIVDALVSEVDGATRQVATSLALRLGAPRCAVVLGAAAAAPGLPARLAAASALSQCPSREAASVLYRMAGDSEPLVSQTALSSYGAHPSADQAALQMFLADPVHRVSVLRGAVLSDRPDTLAMLVNALSGDWPLRWTFSIPRDRPPTPAFTSAMRALAGSDQPCGLLAPRTTALTYLASAGDDYASGLFTLRAQSPCAEERAVALEALGGSDEEGCPGPDDQPGTFLRVCPEPRLRCGTFARWRPYRAPPPLARFLVASEGDAADTSTASSSVDARLGAVAHDAVLAACGDRTSTAARGLLLDLARHAPLRSLRIEALQCLELRDLATLRQRLPGDASYAYNRSVDLAERAAMAPGSGPARCAYEIALATKSSSPETRVVAVDALARCESAEAVNLLRTLCDDDDVVVRRAARRALAAHPGSDAAEHRRAPASDGVDDDLRDLALGTGAALAMRLVDGNVRRRCGVALPVMPIDEPSSDAGFLAAMRCVASVSLSHGWRYPNRTVAIRNLATSLDRASLPLLRASVASDEPDERVASIKALAALHDEASIPRIEVALEDAEPAVVEAAVRALASMRPLRAAPPIARAIARACADVDDPMMASCARLSLLPLGLVGEAAARLGD